MTNLNLVGIFVACCLMGAAMPAQARNAALADFRWKNRVLVVVAPSAADGDLTVQRRIFRQALNGMTERDVVLVEAAGEDARAREIRTQLSIKGDTFRAVLVGKDGHAAFAAAKPVTATELFAKIDAMPMRRDEMRRGK